jgi:tetratricopeptide (TPR) repeat protein
MRTRRAAVLLPAVLLLAACAARAPLVDPSSRSVELVDTPFFPQRTHQCGPAALATVLNASGVAVQPDALTAQVYLPGRRGSLTVEMQAAPRRYGRLSYALAPDLQAITRELAAGRPVLVLHNYGLPVWPRWHYAVVIGFDATRQQVMLRSGVTQRQVLSARNFMRAWDNADRWAVVLLKPGELPVDAASARYLEAATAFERTATPADAARVYEAAVSRWPEQAVAWAGRGTARYRAGLLREAAADYRRAVDIDASLAGARNNLAQTWIDLHCPAAARQELERIDDTGLNPSLRAAVDDTRAQLDRYRPAAEAANCPATPSN